MEANGISSPTSPVITGPTVQPQANSAPPGEKAKGVVSKLKSGHFEGKGVSDVRLRIAHFDNPDLEPVDPASLPNADDVPGNAYAKFLGQYEDKYEAWLANQAPVEPEASPAPEEPDPVVVVLEPELIIEDTVVETPPITEPTPAGESNGALAAFMEILEDNQALKEEAGTLDILT